MTVPVQQNAFTIGEVSPSLFGRFDLARNHLGASTFRNGFVSYRGGFYSRAGTAFVGYSRQIGRAYPPRLITFQFNINQGLALEFGNFYMRVILDGAFVTNPPLTITGVTQANPCVVTALPTSSGASAVSVDSGVTTSYVPGDLVNLAGGTFTVRAQIDVQNTKLVGLAINAAGTGGYVPGDTIMLLGGVRTIVPMLTVTTTQVVSAAPYNTGSGGTPGAQTLTGTTGTGTKVQISVTVSGAGRVSSVNSISVAGSYTTNPTRPNAEPMSGGGFSVPPALSLQLGVLTFAISNGGSFTTNAPGATFTQLSTSGIGVGATFQTAVFGPNQVNFSIAGGYSVLPANPVAQSSTTGAGAGATFNVTWSAPSLPVNGDWIALAGIAGMTNLNGQTFVAAGVSGNTFQLNDVYGNAINSTAFPAYVSGGTAAVIYTLQTPYAEADLPYLKFTESADDMSICCVNQQTKVEYQPQDLARLADDNWTLSTVIATTSAVPPLAASATASAVGSVDYAYVVTSVDPNDGTESVASPIASVNSAVNIAATAGTITVTWDSVPGVSEFNVYKATPGVSAPPPAGSLFGFAAKAYGTQMLDSNIVADFSQVPPTHNDPFAPGAIINVSPTAGGTTYTTATVTINSLTGSGALVIPIIVGGAIVDYLINAGGSDYQPTDTVTITGNGSAATASLTIGPENGTFPGTVAYYQERRGYANTINQPDDYFFSQPGAFKNFDSRIPTIGSDAIVGAPWSVQVNGVQFMIPMPGGLVVLTGLSAWQLTGTGGSALNPQPLEPSTQQAQPQAYNGCSATVPPIKIDYDILYVQAKGSIVRDLAYQFYTNIYTGTDITLNSSHLFVGFTIKEWAWCEEPYKVLWAVRNDGTLLALTYLKPQEVAGWARSDTNGFFESVCSVTEPPVDALYVATQRFPGTNTAYMIERMDNRIWGQVEDCWCVDCALSLPQPEPAANLTASSAYGLGACAGVTGLVGGTNWSASTTATVVDAPMQPGSPGGPGAGAVPVLTIVGGVITNIAFGPGGVGYLNPMLVYNDPANTGSGASATITLDNSATFSADAAVFAVGNIGSVIRAGGGIAVITAFTDNQHVTANMLSPITQKIPNSGGVPQKQPSGYWTMTAPVSTITGLNHLAGATVTGLADGNVVPPTVVAANGTINLATAASAVTIGLGFRAQLQSLYLDSGEPTVQGARKKVAAVTARIESSRGLQIGSNQPDGSTQNPVEVDVAWRNLTAVPDDGPNFPLRPYNALAIPLRTGDIRIPLGGGFATPGQVCIQQDNPLPMQVLSLVSEEMPGDNPQLKAPQRQERARQSQQ